MPPKSLYASFVASPALSGAREAVVYGRCSARLRCSRLSAMRTSRITIIDLAGSAAKIIRHERDVAVPLFTLSSCQSELSETSQMCAGSHLSALALS